MIDPLIFGFRERFERDADFLASAPGRVNIIGEHTDYNDGLVLPAAIEQRTWIAGARRGDRTVRLAALDLSGETEFDLDAVAPSTTEPWSNYVRGVAAGLVAAGYPVTGLDAAIVSEVPIGSGLSSSAALQMAAVQAFAAAGGFIVPEGEAARIGQRAEHTFVGTMCGLMDQLASVLGQPDHLLLIDCRDLSHRAVPLSPEASILIADTGVRRTLSRSAYNERRAQCEEAASAMGVPALRDATLAMLAVAQVPDVVARRAEHVISENERVVQAVCALEQGALADVGRLMNASHESLRLLYEVSSPELDLMVSLLRQQPGCLGARLTGAGFGGCAVALMESGAVEAAVPPITARYRAQTGLAPALYVTRAAAGAHVTPI